MGASMAAELSAEQRDFMLLNIFVLAQHGYIERAGTLAEALYVLGDNSAEVVLARAVLHFFSQNWSSSLACLEELDGIAPIEKFGIYRMNSKQRMRRYLKARCFHEMSEHFRARDVVQSYIRHGIDGQNSAGALEAAG
jgi:hypothetical protein